MADHNLINILPSDLLFDIFSRIAINSVVQFRVVAKPWLHFLTEAFILRLHSRYQKSLKVVLCHYDQFYPIHLESLKHNGEINLRPSKNITLYNLVCWGSCNGLLCITFTCGRGNNLLGLWNPSTGEYINLPSPNPIRSYKTVLGVGFNPTNNDYVVVRILRHGSNSMINIFSLATNSWQRRSKKIIPYRILSTSRKSGVLVGGALHWAVYPSNDFINNLVIAFSIGSERIEEIPQPQFECHKANMEVAEIGGDLCLVYCLSNKNEEVHMEAWVMKDYGVSSSWIKLFKVEALGDRMPPKRMIPGCYTKDEEDPGDRIMPQRSLIPVCYTKDGNILLHMDGVSLVLYDPREKKLYYIKTKGFRGNFETVTYIESQVEFQHGQNKEYLSFYF